MRTIGVTIRQATILLVVGLAVGLAVNAARGKNRINLSRDYTPKILTSSPADPNTPTPPARAEPYNTITVEEVAAIVADASRAGLDLIVDARNDDLYGRGHIPNAVQCDAYNLEDHINEVLSMALGAERVIVYCHGGNCEDSYLLCQELVMRGVQKEALYVFKAGWDGWQAYQRGETDGAADTTPGQPFKAIELSQVLELFEDPRATDKLRARTRASLDGFGIDDIDTLAARIREQLDGHARRAAQGAATAQDAATAGALRTALAAHQEVLDWLVETDTCVYHCQLG